MQSRWNAGDADTLDGLDLLVYASRLIGAETSLVVWGGGNTSIKTVERDHRGREVGVLRVKGSGSDLKSVQRKDFPGVRMDDILALLDREDMGDQEMVSYLAHALQDPGGTRPSIETLLHGFLPAPAVVHWSICRSPSELPNAITGRRPIICWMPTGFPGPSST